MRALRFYMVEGIKTKDMYMAASMVGDFTTVFWQNHYISKGCGLHAWISLMGHGTFRIGSSS